MQAQPFTFNMLTPESLAELLVVRLLPPAAGNQSRPDRQCMTSPTVAAAVPAARVPPAAGARDSQARQ